VKKCGMDVADSGYETVTGCCEKVTKLWVLYRPGNFWITRVTIGFSRRTVLHGITTTKKVLTVLRGPLAYPNGLLDLHRETFGRTP
jgi:hypothetical protein